MSDTPMKFQLCQRLRAKNTVSGNPNRVYLQYTCDDEDGCEVTRIRDEGYAGRPSWCTTTSELPEIDTTAGTIRDWKKFGKDKGILERS